MCGRVKFMKEELLRLSKVAPRLTYSTSLACLLSLSQQPTHEIIRAYFAQQPEDYVHELEQFEQINGASLPKERRAFIFVPAFNEERNIASLVDQYLSQRDKNGLLDLTRYEICFVINYPEHSNSNVNRSYAERFERAIDILLEKKKTHKNIHILAKVFGTTEGSLGRARKYGMDYCLWRALKQVPEKINQTAIISNEGDTLGFPKDYIIRFIDLFRSGILQFVQGRINYPKEIIDICEPVRLFTGCREVVHFGQGLASDEFFYFDGIMPIGRNFAVSPRVYAQVGGIDPIRRKDTDDDMNFGTDIHVRLGEHIKSVCTIPIITNPRREIIIIRDIIAGRKQDSKKSYEQFHENRELYDLAYVDVVDIARNEIPSQIPNRQIQCELANQYFQWVLISRYKAHMSGVDRFAELIERHRNHKISYWEKERELCVAFEQHLARLPQYIRKRIEDEIVTEALKWFNKFVSSLGVQYNSTREGLKSVLQ